MGEGGEILPGNVSIGRKLTGELTKPIFPQEVVHISKDGLSRASEHVSQSKGLIVAFTHNYGSDGPQVMSFLARQKPFNMKKIISSIAYNTFHRNKAAELGYRMQGSVAGIDFYPVVTPETKRKSENKGSNLLQGKGLPEYVDAAVDTLKSGGIVPIALQGEGNTKMFGEPTEALSMLLKRVEKRQVGNYGILFIGLEIPGEDKAKEGSMPEIIAKMKLGKRTELRIGDFYTANELSMAAEADGQPIEVEGRMIKKVDSFAFKSLAKLLSPENKLPIYK